MRRLCLLVLLCGVVITAQAQDQITDTFIPTNAPVEDTITERSIFDRWRFRAQAGDVFTIRMIASDGLAPLIGVMGAGGDIIARSDTETGDADTNATIEMTFVAPESREYSVIATRVGNQDGTTTGSYTLSLNFVENRNNPDTQTQDVTFRCGEHIVTTATTINFTASPNVETYRISVYGLDDFDPIIRVVAGLEGELRDCTNDSQTMGGDRITLPDGETLELPDNDAPEGAARLSLRGIAGRIELTIGSIDGAAGRYLLVLDGFELPPEAQDVLEIRLGPLATESDMLVYMAKVGRTRLDPLLELLPESDEDEVLATCDDAGRRGCEDVPALEPAEVMFSTGFAIPGDRFDAGLRLAPGNQDRMHVGFRSRAENASGAYAVLILGALPD